jgi:hypothetical protein
VIYEYRRFAFSLDDDNFYDLKDKSTLILFASEDDDSPLPTWLKFEPSSRIFFGVAPKAGIS